MKKFIATVQISFELDDNANVEEAGFQLHEAMSKVSLPCFNSETEFIEAVFEGYSDEH